MVKTIGNPLTWTVRGLAGTTEHVTESITKVGGEEHSEPEILPLDFEDIRDALRRGYADFGATRTDVMFICLIYPIVGILIVVAASSANFLPLLFPIAAGFALLGPFAAVGLYEVSRRREMGEEVSWLTALDVIRSPNFAAILVLGLYLLALFFAWLVVAHVIWLLTLGPVPPATVTGFVADVLTTGAGWAMIVIGIAVGACFALAVLATSVVSFPLLLDRNVGVPVAVVTSYRVFLANPKVVIAWGGIIAAALFLGSIPAFLGLIIVLPILGHATWHLYRQAVKV